MKQTEFGRWHLEGGVDSVSVVVVYGLVNSFDEFTGGVESLKL
jgi:hypothetical protein